MEHVFVNKLQSGVKIDDVYLISQPILRSTTRGDLYMAMFLGDKTGKLNGRMWQASEEVYSSLPTEGFVHIVGRSETYQNALQIVIDRITVVDAEKIKLDDFLPRTEKNIKEMFEQIKAILGELKNAHLKALVAEFLADIELMKKFCRAPAATQNHHNYLGGLIEHTHSMLNIAKAILPFYPQLQVDLVLAGIFLHDMGKTEELGYDVAFSYTDRGQMLGHITQTVLMVGEKAAALAAAGKAVDDDILNNLQHIILAHHGQYDFGSPKLPATSEAFMVSYLDNLDAKVNQVSGRIENDPGDSNWTGYVKSLESRLYRKRVVD